ncbi:MAG: helix-turn-helix transcriptional regulator [Bacilli bacterium]
MLKFGNKIAVRLEQKDMTQKQLADLLHVDPRAVSRYVNDNAFPPFDTLKKLCNILELDLNNLLEIESNGNQTLLINDLDEARICNALRMATCEEREYYIRGIDYLINEVSINRKKCK